MIVDYINHMKSSSLDNHIANLTQCIRESIANELIQKGITLTFFQSLILQYIAENKSCTAHYLVLVAKKDKAQITRLVNELIKHDLVIREKSPLDKREYILSLTEEGWRYAKYIKEIRVNTSKKMTQGMSSGQQSQLITLIDLMTHNLSIA